MATWGNQTWSFGTWGLLGDENVSLTGQALSASLGDETTQVDVTPDISGLPLTAALDTGTAIDIAVVTFPTGIAMSANLGQADASPDAMATGNQANMGLGSVEAYNSEGWGRYFWGLFEWGATGEWEFVQVTGEALSANLGSVEAVTDVTLTANTLNVAQLTLGQADPAPDANALGQFMLGALGTLSAKADVTFSVTGFALSASLGTAESIAETIASPTGLPLTAALSGPTAVKGNAEVFPTGLGLTMGQGNGSALIWNEVNTGSAPIDPPGWQEVAA